MPESSLPRIVLPRIILPQIILPMILSFFCLALMACAKENPSQLPASKETPATVTFTPSKREELTTQKAPIHRTLVFVPGFFAPYSLWEDCEEIQAFFRERGFRFLVARSLRTDSIESRTQHLFNEIQRLVPSGRFHLLAHSMGGLDSRLLIKKYGLGSRVISLTTISTPHFGTRLAELAESLVCPFQFLCPQQAVPSEYQKVVHAFSNLKPEFLNQVFNPQTPNDPRVKYYSMGFYMNQPLKSFVPLYWWGYGILAAFGESQNDGLVPASSAQWGKSLGNLEADHGSETLPLLYGGTAVYPSVFSRVLEALTH